MPRTLVRVNAAEPNRTYDAGSSVLLGPSVSSVRCVTILSYNDYYFFGKDSMIYHWKANPGNWPRCYITACVATPDQLAAGHKSYTAEGDITAIEIWKVSTPQNSTSLQTLSWNTRPERLSLLGTVNFTSHYAQSQVPALDGQELRWPTPLFNCSSMEDMAVEIACSACRLQFDQLSSFPALGQCLVFHLRALQETDTMAYTGFALNELG